MTVGGTRLDYQPYDNETRMIDIWDIETGELLYEIVNEDEYVIAAYWSPDGNSIAVTYLSEAIDLYDAKDFKFVRRIKEVKIGGNGDDPVSSLVSWKANSTKIAGSKCQFAYCRVWSLNVGDGSILIFSEIPNDTSSYIADLEWNPQYDILASVGSSDDKIMLWNGADGTELLSIETANRWVVDFSWNSAGDKLVAISLYGDIQIWEILYTA
jgi:WD40 repeat protein